ncbi:MAG: radical SAM protein [Bacteroidaceae bacterium]|nr:radical SAM protein [Bacteroidaceae bacterium]MBR1787743.1 radical SAM protein [Bacteroidaceae bacterium]
MRINEIFCSVQGEGVFTGTPSVFIRTSGCNLRCPFCDTRHADGEEMSVEAVVARAASFRPRHAVLTGGEPSLQRELPQLVEGLHREGFFVQIETNGTRPLPPSINWVTCSPKSMDSTVVRRPHELKVVYQGNEDLTPYEREFEAQVYCLQPCDTGNAERNATVLRAAVAYVLGHPRWRLSLQTHKLIGVR